MPTVIALEPFPQVEVELDVSKSLAELRVLAEHDSGRPRVGITLGYYRANARYRYSINADGRGLYSGGVCVTVRRLMVHFGLNRRAIYVAREVRDYPCLREAVLAHEERHALADIKTLGLFLPDLKAALEAEYGIGLVVKASTEGESRTALKAVLDARLGHAIGEFEHRRRRAQSAIDNDDDEARMVASCSAEAQAFLKRFK